MTILQRHPWPGNVRELENTLHRAVLLATGDTIDAQSVTVTGEEAGEAMAATDATGTGGGDGMPDLVGRTVADVERSLIIDTLGHCLGNRTHAANILGISIRTLRNKLKLYGADGFQVPQPGEGPQATR